MTTKVHIVNFGPRRILVRECNPDRKDTTGITDSGHGLNSGETITLYVFGQQNLDIMEEPVK